MCRPCPVGKGHSTKWERDVDDWHGSWGRAQERGNPAVHERAFGRQKLAAWEARWHELTPKARAYFIDVLKGPSRNQADHAPTYTLSKDKVPPDILEELSAAGFAKVQPALSGTRASTDRVFVPAELLDFATRVRMLSRLDLLQTDRPDELRKYVDQAFYGHMFLGTVSGILRAAGINDYPEIKDALKYYVTNRRWPEWVGQKLKSPLAERVLEVLREAGGPIPLVELPGRIAGSDPDKVRSALDKLIANLAVVEGLQPGTSEILVGFLPSVREGLIRAGRSRERPPLVACDRPKEVGPDDSPIVGDLRAFLFEVASEPPRLRQDGHLFQKEVDRFLAGLEPLPPWLLGVLEWSDEGRLNQALAWARTLRLAEDVTEGGQLTLRLSSKGDRWLSSGLDAQYAGTYETLNDPSMRHAFDRRYHRLFASGPDSYDSGVFDDSRFLGDTVVALKLEKGKSRPDYWSTKPEDVQDLRKALERAFAALELGTFYRLDSVVSHLVYAEHNPVKLGLAPDRVAVIRAGRPVPPLEELLEETGRSLIESFVHRRLIPMGCVRAAIDAEGKVCIARERRLDAYFGRKVPAADLAPAATEGARVVVQPDFSVIIIGLNPTAAAELAPFCERATASGGRGAMILKITRDSVVKAVGHGLKAAEIIERLRRHASNEVPANVLREVQDWSSWVRHVIPATLTVLQCPDKDTADRVESALRRDGERLNETLVAIGIKLTAAERAKLRTQGIIVQATPGVPASRPKSRKKKRRW
jgi:hypothetical protein